MNKWQFNLLIFRESIAVATELTVEIEVKDTTTGAVEAEGSGDGSVDTPEKCEVDYFDRNIYLGGSFDGILSVKNDNKNLTFSVRISYKI